MPDKVIFLTATGAGTWTVPSDWSNTNKVETVGGGGGGKNGTVAAAGGGGGGAYSSRSNITTFTPGSTVVNFSVGVGGSGGGSSQDGGDTWFGATTLASSLVGAKGGVGATAGTGGAGGASASGFPTSGGTRTSGGAGGAGGAALTGGGGGGAGGPAGTGAIGGTGDATAAGADNGGGGGGGSGSTVGTAGGAGTTSAGPGGAGGTGALAGGNGGSGAGVAGGNTPAGGTALWTSTHLADATTTSVVTAAPGGGGGGGGSAAGAGAAGSSASTNTRGYGGGGGGAGNGIGGNGIQGIIVITYTPAATVVAGSGSFAGSSALAAAGIARVNLGTPAALRSAPATVGRQPENRVRDCNDLSTTAWERAAGVTCTPNYGTTTAENGQTVPTCRLQTTTTWQTLKQHLVAPGGRTHYTSFWARSLTGAQQRWGIYDGSFVNYLFIETTWTLVGLAHTNQTIDITSQLIGDGPGDIETFGWEDNLGTARAGFAGLGFPKIGSVADIDSGLIGRYPLEADANATVGVNGTALGSFPAFASGYATFNGSNQAIKIADTFSRAGLARSFSVWFRTTDSDGVIIGQMGAGNIPAIGLIAGGKVSGTWWAGSDINVQSPGGFADNVWHHVVWQYSGGTAELFVDGVSRGTVSGTINETWWFDTYIGYAIGSGGGGSRPIDEYFTGSIDDFRVYDRALTQAEITALTFSRGEPYGPRAGLGLGHPNTFINLENDLVTLSDGGKTATITGNANRSPTVLKSVSDRPIYWEAVSRGKNAQGWSGKPGFARANCPIDYLSGVGTVVVDPDGKIWLNNVHWGWTDSNWIGDRICFAVDPQNRQFWVRVNNGSWSGWTANNPAARTGGFPLDATDFPLPVFPACYLNNTGDSVSIYTSKADWTLTPPLGYGEIPVTTTAVTFAAGTPAALRTAPATLGTRYLGEQRYPHLEQYVLEQINIYRANPPAFSQGVGFSASAPVVLSPKLLGAARAHNMWEISNDIFQHDEEVGIGIPEQVTRYDWFLGRSGSFGIFQNHQWFTTVGRTQKQVADDMMLNYRNSSAHNSNILDTGHKEVGSAFTYIADGGSGTAGEFQGFTDGWWNTQDFGSWSPDAVYLTGVVYSDSNGNGLYDIGEGVTGAIVEATDSGSTVRTATTRVGGGYELSLPAGVHGIRVSKDGGSTWTTSSNVTIGTVNVKFDKAYASGITASSATFAGATASSPKGTQIQSGAVLSYAGNTVAAFGAQRVATAAAGFAGSGSLAGASLGVIPASVAFAGASALAPAATRFDRGSASLSGASALAAGATAVATASASLSGSSALAAATKLFQTGFTSFSGSSALSGAGTPIGAAFGSFSGASAFAATSTGTIIVAASASFSGATTFAELASALVASNASLAGSTAFSAATSTSNIVAGNASLAGGTAPAAASTRFSAGSLSLSGSSSLAAATLSFSSAAALFAGASNIAASGANVGTGPAAQVIVDENGIAIVDENAQEISDGIIVDNYQGAASFAGTSAFAPTASRVVPASLSLSGSSALAPAASILVAASGSFSGSSAFAPDARVTVTASISFAGQGSFAPFLAGSGAAAAAFAGSSAPAFAASVIVRASAGFSGASALAGATSTVLVTNASLSGSSNLSVAASIFIKSDASLAGASNFAAFSGATVIVAGSAAFLGSGQFGPSPGLITRGTAAFSGAGSFAPFLSGQGAALASFAGASTAAFGASVVVRASAGLAGSSALSGAAAAIIPATGTFSGATTTFYTASQVIGASASLSGSSSVAVAAQVIVRANLSLSGFGSFAPSQSGLVAASAGFSGAAALAPAAGLMVPAAIAFAGTSSLAGVARAVAGAQATFQGASAFTPSATVIVRSNALLDGSSAFSATGSFLEQGLSNVVFLGSGAFAPSASLVAPATIGFTGQTALAAIGRAIATASGTFAGAAGLFAPAAQNVVSSSVAFQGGGDIAITTTRIAKTAAAFQGSSVFSLSAFEITIRPANFTFVGTGNFGGDILDLALVGAPAGFGTDIVQGALYDPTIKIGAGVMGTKLEPGMFDPTVTVI